MKEVIGAVLLGFILTQPITVQANCLSDTDIPTNIMEYCEIIGHQYNICPELLMSIAYQESRFIPDVENGPCKGIMQINAELHKDRFTEAGWDYTDWSNAYKNIYVAADYLAELFEEHEDVAEVLYLYNGDQKSLNKYRKSGYISDYVNEILIMSEELERAHGK